MKKSIVLATAVASVLTSGIAAADFTGNAAVTSNYIWRGVTQTSDQAAGQGGLDFDIAGFYVGTWVSNVDFSGAGDGYEMDVYAGWGFESDNFGLDLGVISYQYPVTPEFNFTEVYASGTFTIVTVGVATTVDAASGNDGGQYDTGDLYLNGSLDFSLGKSDISFYAGSYTFDNDGLATLGDADYIHYGASIGANGFTFALDKNDIDVGTADNMRVSVSYAMDFEL